MAGAREFRYRVVETRRFTRDRRKLLKMGRYDMRKLATVVEALAGGDHLPARLGNHKLHGAFAGCEECRIESDWLLVYRRLETVLVLQLLRTGTHAQLFGE